jgi:hypothetical protein
MPLPLEKSRRVGIRGRAKALGVLVLPFLVFAVVVFLASALVRIHPGVARKPSGSTPIGADDWLSADTASSAGATVEVSQTSVEASGKPGGKGATATTVTTHTILGTF